MLVHAQLGQNHLLLGLWGGDQVLATVFHPSHRSTECDRGECNSDLLRRRRDLLAEAAADVRDDHPDSVLRQAGGRRQATAQQMMPLGRCPHRQSSTSGVVVGHTAPRLHRGSRQPASVELGSVDPVRRGHDRIGFAKGLRGPVDDVGAEIGEQQRSVLAGGSAGIGHRRKGLVAGEDEGGAVFGDVPVPGNYHSYRLSDKADPARGEWSLGRLEEAVDTYGVHKRRMVRKCAAGKHSGHPVEFERPRRIDCGDRTVGNRGAHERGLERTGYTHVGEVLTLPG